MNKLIYSLRNMKSCLRIIRSLCAFSAITFLVLSCIVDPNPSNVKIVYENATPVEIVIQATGPSNLKMFETRIPVGESSDVLMDAKDIYEVFNPGRISSIKVIFDDGKEFLSDSFDAEGSLLNVKTYEENAGSYCLIIDSEYYISSDYPSQE